MEPAAPGATTGYHQATSQPEGARTFEVLSLEGGTPGPSVEHDWVVTSDPVVQWISEPTGTYDSRYVTTTFTAPEAASFQCRLNGLPAGWGSCSGSSGQQGMWESARAGRRRLHPRGACRRRGRARPGGYGQLRGGRGSGHRLDLEA
ncbi:MAG: hypothetical protein R2789_17905 [Microthrixaceae bacterium]